ncbi:hypothetical protein SAMN05421542_3501 [Chryseobacterium jejuense]|uniref:Uncharacterized protein n=1 Tax=Chryseobacterium jejuense TaxID=445960 RepID=A0A2X2X5R6_CHRJE|nr:hypothetical protein SAMN05421542_3501 [Chryseobacterium jejuense]SQB46001.1 Uncharacterised protein [Chryseobacterium jejuense]
MYKPQIEDSTKSKATKDFKHLSFFKLKALSTRSTHKFLKISDFPIHKHPCKSE